MFGPKKEGDTNFAQIDLVLEYVGITGNKTALVALQENNALAEVNLKKGKITGVFGLGYKDWTGIPFDTTDKDDGFNPTVKEGVTSARMPDGNLPGLDYVGGTSGEGTARETLLEPLPLIQAEIDRLTNQGINKTIFIDHAQDCTDQSVLPAELDGVDVIIQAGMTGYMSADTPSDPFNLLRTEDTGNPITYN